MHLRSWLAVASITFASVDVVVAATAFDQSHAAFSHLLGQRVRDGLVDYATLKSEPRPLAVYLDRLAQIAESEFDAWPEKERLAYLINLYNAATLKLIVDHYPVKSIRSIGWLPGSAWKQDVVKLFGRTLSLDEVEHGIIRRDYQDPRVHFALVCAAHGCPPLRAEAFVASRLDEQLEEQGRVFFRQASKNRVDAAGHVVHLSPIFKWFAEDFVGRSGSVLKFVAPFFHEDAQRALAGDVEFEIRYTDYDWSLNDQTGAGK